MRFKIKNGTLIECNVESKVKEILIPKQVKNIEKGAFRWCDDITRIIIQENVTNIDENVFYGCKNLINIDISSRNSKYASIDGVLFSKDCKTLIYCPRGKSGNYTIPKDVTSIREGAFSGL